MNVTFEIGETFRTAMRQEFARRCQKNPRYSIRSFAAFLESDFSTVAKHLNGKRPIGKKTIERFGVRLGMEPSKINSYVRRLREPNPEQTPHIPYAQIDDKMFRVVSEWYHYAILELMRIETFEPDLKWIARSLGITLAEVTAAVDRLVNCGMIAIDTFGKWHDLTGERSTNITQEISSVARRNHQKQVLELALNALENTLPHHRDQTSMTMAVDREKLGEARQLIAQFRRDLAILMSRNGNLNDVFNLSISLYPITSQISGDKQ